eukprot:CAMPEP_0194042200 /NCGR_PEP_ID=MMETSP0009_2-20130614/13996_1 /TAXON_ID=210454 /ORGANISM="Grammatophora oceanica, Strain CCMP 410" /LENGTH=262 /DNA_ID=CAMNT_0038685953 /DNA_START=118 /DNA_END=903 /DNA_ORIENTATION=+
MSGGFGWALPDNDQDFKLPSQKSKPDVANPLLNTRGPVFNAAESASTGQSMSRSPLTSIPVQSNGLRLRTNSKPGLLPPKASLTLDGGGIWNEKQDSVQTRTKSDAGNDKSPLRVVSKSIDLDRWIVITGLPLSSTGSYSNDVSAVVQQLESLGHVVTRRRGGNWMALEYRKALSAEKARCQGPWVLKERNLVVQVVRLTPDLRVELDWSPTSSWVRKRASEQDKTPMGPNVLLSEDSSSAFVRNGAGKSTCQIVMEFLFGW